MLQRVRGIFISPNAIKLDRTECTISNEELTAMLMAVENISQLVGTIMEPFFTQSMELIGIL